MWSWLPSCKSWAISIYSNSFFLVCFSFFEQECTVRSDSLHSCPFCLWKEQKKLELHIRSEREGRGKRPELPEGMELARVLRIDTTCEEHRLLLQAIKEVFYEPGCWSNGSGDRKNSTRAVNSQSCLHNSPWQGFCTLWWLELRSSLTGNWTSYATIARGTLAHEFIPYCEIWSSIDGRKVLYCLGKQQKSWSVDVP